MKLTFNNSYGNKGKVESTEIEIEDNCQITNYDPREKSLSAKGDLKINVNGENSSIMTGKNLQEDSTTVNLNKNKYSIFTQIASMDGDGSTLTRGDIENLYESYTNKDNNWQELLKAGVTALRYDRKAGVATIVIGEKELIRIDFKTWWERIGYTSDSSKLTVEEPVTAKDPVTAEKKQLKAYSVAISKIAKDMNTTEDYINEQIEQIAGNIPCSKDLVEHLLITEQFIRTAKTLKGEHEYTVGFGHTTNAESNNDFVKGYKITNKKAFEWFEQDIKDYIKKAKQYFPDCNWDEMPQSIKDSLTDLAFNRSNKALRTEYNVLKDCLKKGGENYVSAAVNTRQIFKTPPQKRNGRMIGLMKRSCYRFLLAIQDLSAQQQLKAMEEFDSGKEPYYTTTYKQLKRIGQITEANTLKKDWDSAMNTAKTALGIPCEEKNTYEIQNGDNLIKIANKFGITVDELKLANNLKSNNITAGYELIIPSKTDG